ncbi:MAG: DNA gyrase inhibitor YacG, partial [Candidatus Accumulibacter sp.]|nr:DNA gyrase inhibitor YacG [Accumulibacter sp.]
ENKYRPFCSERCKLIDLGAWASEAYRVPTREEAIEPPGEQRSDET